MKNIQKYLLILLTMLTYSQSYAACTADIEDVNFGSFVIRDTPENNINTNIQFICDPIEVDKTMTISFSKTTMENSGNSVEFDIFIGGNKLIANQNYQFVINDSDIINIPVSFKVLNSNNSYSTSPSLYSSSIVLQYSY